MDTVIPGVSTSAHKGIVMLRVNLNKRERTLGANSTMDASSGLGMAKSQTSDGCGSVRTE